MPADTAVPPKRNKSFEETHRELIETSVRLIAERGASSVSLAALARAVRINRTTVYYHFPNREALMREVKLWSSQQLARAFDLQTTQEERIDYITRFVLDNPELIKLWIDEFTSPGDIRDRYPSWDRMVKSMAAHFASIGEQDVDAEIYALNVLITAFIGPHIFKASIAPAEAAGSVVHRFRIEQERMLRLNKLMPRRKGQPTG